MLLLVLFVAAVAGGSYAWAQKRADTVRESYGRSFPARVVAVSKPKTKCQLFGLWCISWRSAEVEVRAKSIGLSTYHEVELEASARKGQRTRAWFENGNPDYTRFENEREGPGSFDFKRQPWEGGSVAAVVAIFSVLAFIIGMVVLRLAKKSSDEARQAEKEPSDADRPSMRRTFIVWVNILNTVGLIGVVASSSTRKTSLHIYESISATDALYAVVGIVVVIGLVVLQWKLFPVLKWSWTKYLGKDHEGVNLSLTTLKIPWFGPIYGGMLFFALPLVARVEEEIFRKGTHGWLQGLIMSVLFGMAHCVVGVPLAAGIALSVMGLWLTQNYFWGGLHQSVEVHATYDAILIVVLGVALLVQHILERSERKKTVAM